MAKPIVILLDFDGTIVGDVEWLVNEKNLLQFMQIKSNGAYLVKDLAKGVIRPHFKYFITELRKRFPLVEFYIYTASEKFWAEFIIAKVERAIGIKFNRPIFTRNHCVFNNGHYTKQLHIVKPIIMKRLAMKYGTGGEYQSMVMIDNTPNVLNERQQQITCPSYDYEYPIHLLRHLPETFSYEKVSEFLGRLYVEFRFKKPPKNSQRFWSAYYQFISTKFHKAYKYNKSHAYLKDQYWKNLADAFIKSNISTMNSYEIKELAQGIHE